MDNFKLIKEISLKKGIGIGQTVRIIGSHIPDPDTKTDTGFSNSKNIKIESTLVGTSKCQIHVLWILNQAENQLIKNIFWILCQPQRLTHCWFRAISGTKLTQRIHRQNG